MRAYEHVQRVQGRWIFAMLAALAVGSCSDSSTLEIRARGSLQDSLALAGLRLHVGGRVFQAGDFSSDASGLTSVKLDVPNSGRLQIRVELFQHDSLAAEGSFGWEMSESWEWGVDIFRTADDPTTTCMGCRGTAQIPLESWAAATPGESLWFAWGGKPKGSDIVY